MRIIHISDTHFTGSSDDKNKIEMIVSSITNYIPKLWGGGEYLKTIVITGDLTDSGDEEDYKSARNLITTLQGFGFNVYVVPGNHDYCEHGILSPVVLGPYGSGKSKVRRQRFVDYICSVTHQSSQYPQVIDLDFNCKLILLDSMQAEMNEDTGDEFAQGKLGIPQLSILNEKLAGFEKLRRNGTKIIVALHHHPFKPEAADDHGLTGLNRGGLVDAQQFVEIVANKIDCLLFGHSTTEDYICQEFFENESVMYGIPIINVENLEHMDDHIGDISVVDLDNNRVTVYPTDITKTPKEPIRGKIPSNTEIYVTPTVTRGGAVIYNYSDAAPSIKFQPGDRVTITIGGAVQTGGKGNTWKRYVNPRGDNSDSLYFGQIYIPGITGINSADGLNPIRNLVARYGSYDSKSPDKCTLKFTIPKIDVIPESNRYLALGYVDDGYSDNGYWSHDDGTEDQCKNVGPAYVKIDIQHKPSILSVRQYLNQIGADPNLGIRHLLSGGATSVRDLLSY